MFGGQLMGKLIEKGGQDAVFSIFGGKEKTFEMFIKIIAQIEPKIVEHLGKKAREHNLNKNQFLVFELQPRSFYVDEILKQKLVVNIRVQEIKNKKISIGSIIEQLPFKLFVSNLITNIDGESNG